MREDACARLCLLTRAAWSEDLLRPMTRPAVRGMIASGALSALVLREVPGVGAPVLDRAARLLSRAHGVYALMQVYEARGYSMLLPEEAGWPRALGVLGGQMPLFLFARGNPALLDRPRIAVAGSRDIAPGTRGLAREVGRRLAREGIALVCGGARGVDAAVQEALLASRGALILVPAVPVEQLLAQRALRRALDEGRLLILCETLPDDPFSSERALARNHTIYALGDAALVLAARVGVGGSWRGAADCLRGGFAPVYVADDGGADTAGNRALLERGARRFALTPEMRLGDLTTGGDQLTML